MFNKIFKIGDNIYTIDVKKSTFQAGGYFSVVISDDTIIAIDARTLNLLSYDPDSAIMSEIIGSHYTGKKKEKTYMLLNGKSLK